MSVTQLRCPGCGRKLKIRSGVEAHAAISCPKCKHRFALADVKPAAAETNSGETHRPATKRPRKRRSPLVTVVLLAGALLIGTGAAGVIALWQYFAKEYGDGDIFAAIVNIGRKPATAHRPVPESRAAVSARQIIFDDWEQDFEAAKKRAAVENKDMLLLFDGSDWCPWSIKMVDDVMLGTTFCNNAKNSFVLVFIDFPKYPVAKGKVRDPARNERLAEQFGIEGYPTVMVADAQGRPYALHNYSGNGAAAGQRYLAELLDLRKFREQRDQLFADIDKAQGGARLNAAQNALGFLKKRSLVGFYRPQLEEWSKLADTHDPKNEQGLAEVFFEADWWPRAIKAEANVAEGLKTVTALDGWKNAHGRFKDGDRAARLHLRAGQLLAAAGKFEDALGYIQDGLSYGPRDANLQQSLANSMSALGLGSGTGFIISEDGLILTAHHVIEGPGRVLVPLPRIKKPLRAKVVARDKERDMALLRIDPPKEAPLKALSWAKPREVGRGEQVAVLGFPLGDWYGRGLKLTTGVVSATPEIGNRNMLILDARVNPGNSGGPLCDAFGNVVGLVTAKSYADFRIESYGMALPAGDLDRFLAQHVKARKFEAGRSKRLPWDEIDRMISPSVVMILKAPLKPRQTAPAQADDKSRRADAGTP